jgi:hypothetical protein
LISNRIVLCMKWGSLYGSDYVNVLFNACRKNINGQFQFVCLTDNPTGIDKSIQTLPIPDIGCSPEMWMQGAWPKLSIFMENLYDLKGRVLFIDMDTVVWGSLDKFFEYSGSFVGIDTGINWRPNRLNGGTNALLGTGVFAFNMGEQSQVLSRFQYDSDAAFKKCGIEQVWVQENVQNISYWPQDWVISFKRWLRRPIGLDLFLEPKKPAPETGLIAFHGIPRPIELVRSKGSRWDQFPHMGHGTVGWMRDYWLENGGNVD